MRSGESWWILSLAVTFGWVSGCVAWTSGTVRTFETFPTPEMMASQGRPAVIGMDVSYQVVGVCVSEGCRKSQIETLQGWAEDVFDRAPVFSWSGEAAGQEYRLVLDVRHDSEDPFTRVVISGLTLTLFPAWATETYTIDASLQDAHGNKLAQRQIRQEYTLVVELFMVFGLPFAEFDSVYRDMWRETFEDLAVWCHQEIQKLRGNDLELAGIRSS